MHTHSYLVSHIRVTAESYPFHILDKTSRIHSRPCTPGNGGRDALRDVRTVMPLAVTRILKKKPSSEAVTAAVTSEPERGCNPVRVWAHHHTGVSCGDGQIDSDTWSGK